MPTTDLLVGRVPALALGCAALPTPERTIEADAVARSATAVDDELLPVRVPRTRPDDSNRGKASSSQLLMKPVIGMPGVVRPAIRVNGVNENRVTSEVKKWGSSRFCVGDLGSFA